ncbi:urease accessory protein UreD [Luteolibacter yonseiensis]|uniref:Urease accessory protein UreD n=1 Tax=Luteolibacter yonseiensis TaxID=1144680 RepID=A0A934R3E3_9BACT|nr:urease accessory protein UreD [Luteolibacter yonseiensis]MBK1816311.1 urease accessory protein UreD [Luteolibacter yonseiensis]
MSICSSNWSAGFIPREPADRHDESSYPGIHPALPVSGSALSGHLDLRCELRADGVPVIARQSFRAPIHLSKSHVDEGRLVQSIVNPTAGFFDGDRLEMNVEVGGGAKLVLSTPSASRVYRTRSGGSAVCVQHFRVEGNAMLEWIPEPFIPHAGASYVQRTRIDLEPSASLLYFDWISPGRVAMGEVFAYQRLRWELDLTLGGRLIARERYDLAPGNESLEALRVKFPAAHYLSVYAAGGMAENWPARELDALTGVGVYLGHGPLAGGVNVIRALCCDSLSARRLLETIRPLLYGAAGVKPPSLGRIFC